MQGIKVSDSNPRPTHVPLVRMHSSRNAFLLYIGMTCSSEAFLSLQVSAEKFHSPVYEWKDN
jgi:hypothetical protein